MAVYTSLADVVVEVNIQLETVVRPRAELELTGLYVERELRDVDGTRAAKQRWRYPQHCTVVLDHRHRITVLLQSHVRTDRHHLLIVKFCA